MAERTSLRCPAEPRAAKEKAHGDTDLGTFANPGGRHHAQNDEEFIGRKNSGTGEVSIARMRSPSGWEEPGQTPEFDEYTVVLAGILRVETQEQTFDVEARQAVIAPRGSWVRYSTPLEGGADYIAVCVPAFAAESVRRDE